MSKYTDFVRSLPCAVSGYIGEEVDPHHVKGYSWITGACGGKKGHDLTCIPLKHELHQELHQIGWKSFEEKYNFSQMETLALTILAANKEGVIKV